MSDYRGESSGSQPELWTSRTNSADDSRGLAFGLEGDLFIPVVIGAAAGAMLFSTLIMMTRYDMLTIGVWSFLPCAVSIAYVMLFRHGKPKHYDMDLFEESVTGGDGWQRLEYQPKHPRAEASEWDARQRSKKRPARR